MGDLSQVVVVLSLTRRFKPRLLRLGLPKIWLRLLDQAFEGIDQPSLGLTLASWDGRTNTQTNG